MAKTCPKRWRQCWRVTSSLTAMPRGSPAAASHAYSRCLVRDPRQRLRDIGDARRMTRADHRRHTGRRRRRAVGGRAASVPASRRALPWAVAGVARRGARLRAPDVGALAAPLGPLTAPLARQHRHRRVAHDRPRRRGDSVAGWNDARVCRAAGQPDAPVHPQARSVAGDAARRHRGSGLPVLFAERPVDCVLRRDQAEESVRRWRRGGRSVRSHLGSRRNVARGRHDHLQSLGWSERTAHARAGGRRHADAVRHPQPGRDDAALAPGASRRQDRALHGEFDDGQL